MLHACINKCINQNAIIVICGAWCWAGRAWSLIKIKYNLIFEHNFCWSETSTIGVIWCDSHATKCGERAPPVPVPVNHASRPKQNTKPCYTREFVTRESRRECDSWEWDCAACECEAVTVRGRGQGWRVTTLTRITFSLFSENSKNKTNNGSVKVERDGVQVNRRTEKGACRETGFRPWRIYEFHGGEEL